MIIKINPVAKPRMTKRDKWHKRLATMKYWAFVEELKYRTKGLYLGDTWDLIFYLPMPKSWSKKKKEALNGCAHQKRPDIDNLCKSFLDALFSDDSKVWKITAEKRWAYDGQIEIKETV